MLCGVLTRQHKLLLVVQHVGGVAKMHSCRHAIPPIST